MTLSILIGDSYYQCKGMDGIENMDEIVITELSRDMHQKNVRDMHQKNVFGVVMTEVRYIHMFYFIQCTRE